MIPPHFRYVTFWDRVKLIFTRKQVVWDDGWIHVFKWRKGVCYLLHREEVFRNYKLEITETR